MNEKNKKINKKILTIFVIILMIATIIPVTGISTEREQKKNVVDPVHYDFFIGFVDIVTPGANWKDFFRCVNVWHVVVEDGHIISCEHRKDYVSFGFLGPFIGISISVFFHTLYFICGYFRS